MTFAISSGGLVNIGKIGKAVAAARWCADRDKYGVGAWRRRGKVSTERKPSGLHIFRDQAVEAGLVDGHHAVFKLTDLLRILIDADHIVTEIRKAGAGDKTDIAGADHGYAHIHWPFFETRWGANSAAAFAVCLDGIFGKNHHPFQSRLTGVTFACIGR